MTQCRCDDVRAAHACSGMNSGLRLVLNIEQYEHMRGRSFDAGVMLHIHEPGVYPAVSELGFAVAPGVHSLVSLLRRNYRNLGEQRNFSSTIR